MYYLIYSCIISYISVNIVPMLIYTLNKISEGKIAAYETLGLDFFVSPKNCIIILHKDISLY